MDAVFVTPAHQYPTGAVISGARRGALLDWLRRREAFAIEDDYDAEYRYDRAPVGALQGMDPERIVYAGTASKTLAPGDAAGLAGGAGPAAGGGAAAAAAGGLRRLPHRAARLRRFSFPGRAGPPSAADAGPLPRPARRAGGGADRGTARGAGARDPGGAARHGPVARRATGGGRSATRPRAAGSR